MKLRTLMAFAIAIPLLAGGCGVKTDLLMPNGKETPKNEKDPSKPPNPNNSNP